MESGFQPDWRERYLAGEPLRIGNDVQLLLDDYMVEDRFGLRRVIGPVEKHQENPLSMGTPLPGEAGIDPGDTIRTMHKGHTCRFTRCRGPASDARTRQPYDVRLRRHAAPVCAKLI